MDWMELLGLSGMEDFQQVELNELKTFERKHRGRVLRASRRMVAAVLATAMLLPATLNLTTTVARAAGEKLYPPQATRLTDGTSPDDPHIEIESNFVHDKFGFLTGTLELAIRVQSPMYDTGEVNDGNPVYAPRPVQAVSVNLAYNTAVLHPVSWEWVKGESQTTPYDVETNVARYYAAKLETQKDSRVSTAAASTGIVHDANNNGYSVTTNIADGRQGLLYFTARAFKAEPFTEMTTIAVIRFAVDDELMKHIEITKDGDGYKVNYIGYDSNPIGSVATLQAAMAATATATGADTPLPLVEFAQQKDIEDAPGKAVSLESALLYYSDEFTQMNYIPDYYTSTSTSTEEVTRPINGADYKLDRPNTAQSPSKPTDLGLDWDGETLTLARKETAAVPPATDPTVDYSYTTNLIHDAKISFTVVSKESFMAGKDDSNLTTIVYVDWDNTIMGTQIVPKGRDIRQLVSDHVAENFVHEDLRNPTDVTSLKRTDSYRGRYPHSGYTSGNKDETIPDGEKWPLTYKLDYTFFKRQMVKAGKPDPADPKYDAAQGGDPAQYDVDLEAWKNTDTDAWEQAKDAAGKADTTEVVKYPFAYGWAECTLKNYENMWTTMGGNSVANLGELSSYSVDQTTKVASVTYDGTEDFAFADLEGGVTGDTVVLKAIYEPGDEIELTTHQYCDLGPIYYSQYGEVPASTPRTSYVVKFKYERATAPEATGRGVLRTRDPAARIAFTPILTSTDEDTGEVLAETGSPFYMKVPVDNDDVMEVEINPAAEILSLGYSLIDAYGTNYVTGLRRSADNENVLEIDTNFDMENYDYNNRLGSNGYIVKGVLRHILEAAVDHLKYNTTTTNLNLENLLNGLTSLDLMKDVNFRKDASGAEYIYQFELGNVSTQLRALFAAAYASGGKDAVLALDWHQIQYHLLTYDVNTGGTNKGAILGDDSIKSVKDCIQEAPGGQHKYDWCKLHGDKDCSGGDSGAELPINSWADLLDAAYAYGNTATPNSKAMDKLTVAMAHTKFSLATDAGGSWADATAIADLRTKIKDAVYAANAAYGNDNAYKNLTWGQVQYYIINNTLPADDTTAENEYWWVRNYGDNDDGKKGAVDIPDLLAAVDRATNTSFETPDGVTHTNGWPANLKSITADMDKVSNAPLKLRQSKDDTPTDGSPYPSAAAFETAIKALVTNVKTSNPTGWKDGSNLGDWDTLQYNLIHFGQDDGAGGTKPYEPKSTTVTTEAEDYWWKYGTQVTDFATLMEAADATQSQGGDPAADPDGKLLKAVKADLLTDTNTDIHLRKDKIGFPYESGDMTTFVTKIMAIAASVNAAGKTMKNDMTWELLQYMLEQDITDYNTAAAAAYQKQADDYYWWKDGNTGVTDITTLLAAAQEAYGTDGTDGKKAKLSSVVYNGVPGGLAKDFKGTQYSSGTLTAGDTAAQTEREGFQTAMEGFIAMWRGTPGSDTRSAQWQDVQYYILHNAVDWTAATSEGQRDSSYNSNGYYWWHPEAGTTPWDKVKQAVAVSTDTPGALGGGFDPNGINANKMMGDLLFRGFINDDNAASNNSWNDFKDSDNDPANMRFITGFQNGKTSPDDAASDDDLTFADTAAVKTAMAALAAEVVPDWKTSNDLSSIKAGFGYDAATKTVTLDWYVYQYALLNNGALPDNSQYTAITTDGNAQYYWWLNKSSKNSVVATNLDRFLDALETAMTTVTFKTNGQVNTVDVSALTDDIIKPLELYKLASGNYTIETASTIRNKLKNIIKFLYNNPANHDTALGYDHTKKEFNLTWYQIQELMIRVSSGLNVTTGKLATPAEAYKKVKAAVGTPPAGLKIPDWVPFDGTTDTPNKPGMDLLPDNRVRADAGEGASLFLAPRRMMTNTALSTEPELLGEYTESIDTGDPYTTGTRTVRDEYVEARDEYTTTETTTTVTSVPAGEATVVVTNTTTIITITDSGGILLDQTTETNTSTQVITAGGTEQ